MSFARTEHMINMFFFLLNISTRNWRNFVTKFERCGDKMRGQTFARTSRWNKINEKIYHGQYSRVGYATVKGNIILNDTLWTYRCEMFTKTRIIAVEIHSIGGGAFTFSRVSSIQYRLVIEDKNISNRLRVNDVRFFFFSYIYI